MLIDLHVQIVGDQFSPSSFESRTNVCLVDKKEVGDIATVGRYRNKPRPWGSATLRPHEPTCEYGPQLETIVLTMEKHLPTLKQCGGVDVVLWMVIYAKRDEQSNLAFEPQIMGRLSALGIPLAISYYEDTETEEESCE